MGAGQAQPHLLLLIDPGIGALQLDAAQDEAVVVDVQQHRLEQEQLLHPSLGDTDLGRQRGLPHRAAEVRVRRVHALHVQAASDRRWPGVLAQAQTIEAKLDDLAKHCRNIQ